MEYPDFGQRASSSTDSPIWHSVSLTCCWVADGAVLVPSNAQRNASFNDCMYKELMELAKLCGIQAPRLVQGHQPPSNRMHPSTSFMMV